MSDDAGRRTSGVHAREYVSHRTTTAFTSTMLREVGIDSGINKVESQENFRDYFRQSKSILHVRDTSKTFRKDHLDMTTKWLRSALGEVQSGRLTIMSANSIMAAFIAGLRSGSFFQSYMNNEHEVEDINRLRRGFFDG